MAVPEGVYLISGSRVRRPASVTRLMFIDRQDEGPDTGDNVLPPANIATENQKTISHGSTPTRMEKDPLLDRLCATDIFLPSRHLDIVVLFDPSGRLFILSLTTRETHPEPRQRHPRSSTSPRKTTEATQTQSNGPHGRRLRNLINIRLTQNPILCTPKFTLHRKST